MKRLCSVLLAVLLMVPLHPQAGAAAPGTSAASAILMDADSGRVLFAHNANDKRLIASITKLMTALVAVESTPDLDAIVEIKRAYTLAEGSSMYLKEGEELTLEGLLYGLLMASGNDAALAIASYCGGDEATFVDWMNQRAADIGMQDTHFANPNGLNDEAHYSTAADMAKLARVVMDNEILENMVGTKSINIAGRSFVNHNKLLWQYEGCIGMKTGYTDKAGRTLVSCAERNGQRLIVVTLCDPNDWRDHAALFDYGFKTYPSHILARSGKVFRTVPVTGSLARFVSVRTDGDVYYPLTAQERVRAEVQLPASAQAPLAEGAIAGRIAFYLDELPIGETYLVYANSVADDHAEAHNLFERVRDLFCGGREKTALAAFWRGFIG